MTNSTTNSSTNDTNRTGTETLLVTRPDGRRLAADRTGPGDGPAVVFVHSAPGSRRFDPDPTATRAAGVQLITIDRPGYGRSDPIPDGTVPTIPGFAEDIALVLDHLGIDTAGVAGWSAGGRIAACFAARHPDRARALALIGSPAPDEAIGWVPQEHRQMLEQLRPDPVAAVPALTSTFEQFELDDDARLGMVCGGAADAKALDDPAVRQRVLAMVDEAYVPGPAGIAADIVSYTLVPWGIDFDAIETPTACIYGADDPVVSPEHGRWFVDRIAGARLTVVPDTGHLVVIPTWSDVLDHLTAS